jgi:mannitol-1-phosphate/altronate dehydrogenase
VDTIARNARDPQRKLSYNERIIGPACLISKYRGDSTPLEITAAAALSYEDKSNLEWNKLKKEIGIKGIIGRICKIDLESYMAKQILYYYEKLQQYRGKTDISLFDILKEARNLKNENKNY